MGSGIFDAVWSTATIQLGMKVFLAQISQRGDYRERQNTLNVKKKLGIIPMYGSIHFLHLCRVLVK